MVKLFMDNSNNYLTEQGKWADLLRIYKKILALKPNQQQALQGLLGLGANLFGQKKWEESITVSRALLEIKPDSDVAWLIIGGALWEQGKLPEAASAFADGLKVNPNNLDLLSNDAELAFVQGDLTRCQARIAAALPLVKRDNQFFAILPFYQWLSNPAQGWQPVLTAIQGIGPKVKFRSSFDTIKPALGRLDQEKQQIAQRFIEFFEGKIDLPTLQARLAEH
jgi:tetratricopeptide (TPR) repeat protein